MEMDNLIDVANVDEIENGVMVMFTTAKGKELLIARVWDNFYCADNRCPHMGGNLSEGSLDGTVVTCPRHHSKFDLKDGKVIQWTDWSGIKLTAAKIFKSPRPLKTHEVKIEEGKIWVSEE
jgi:3-phenylpropionate/trans-cinnamate dioxygenase ferredoxin component